MRLVDFLIKVLEAHSQTLQRLAALLGEEHLIELLERENGDADAEMIQKTWEVELEPTVTSARDLFGKNVSGPTPHQSQAYAELAGNVREFDLAAILEFHLWAYPPYRAFIESSLDLSARIQVVSAKETEMAQRLVENAVENARSWVRRLPLTPQISKQAETAALIPWIRFRSEVMKRMGQRPLGAVSF